MTRFWREPQTAANLREPLEKQRTHKTCRDLINPVSPSQTQRSFLHSWLRAPGQVHPPGRHTRCSQRCHKGSAWPSHQTAEAWKPAKTHTEKLILGHVYKLEKPAHTSFFEYRRRFQWVTAFCPNSQESWLENAHIFWLNTPVRMWGTWWHRHRTMKWSHMDMPAWLCYL